jgi:hypothetical protein
MGVHAYEIDAGGIHLVEIYAAACDIRLRGGQTYVPYITAQQQPPVPNMAQIQQQLAAIRQSITNLAALLSAQ